MSAGGGMGLPAAGTGRRLPRDGGGPRRSSASPSWPPERLGPRRSGTAHATPPRRRPTTGRRRADRSGAETDRRLTRGPASYPVRRSSELVGDPSALAVEDDDGTFGQMDEPAIDMAHDDPLAAARAASIALGRRIERVAAGRAGRQDRLGDVDRLGGRRGRGRSGAFVGRVGRSSVPARLARRVRSARTRDEGNPRPITSLVCSTGRQRTAGAMERATGDKRRASRVG